VVGVFGRERLVSDLASDDFERLRATIAQTCGPVRVGNEVQRIRVLFKFALDSGLIDRPVRYGASFKRPPRRVLRRLRGQNGPRMFESNEIRRLLDAAGQPLRAMILLGVNCGFGNAECASLPITAVDLVAGWVRFPRPKTGIDRRCPLWPETVEAIQDWLTKRPEPKDSENADSLFVTKQGLSWHKDTSDNPISKEVRKLLIEMGMHRKGLAFYGLHHTFETIGGEALDQVAVDFIMGHVRDDMASVYRERISDERLRRVTEHVSGWLFAMEKK
jgi:integrase